MTPDASVSMCSSAHWPIFSRSVFFRNFGLLRVHRMNPESSFNVCFLTLSPHLRWRNPPPAENSYIDSESLTRFEGGRTAT